MNPLRSVVGTIVLGFVVAAVLALLVGEVAFNPFGTMISLHAWFSFIWMGMLYYLNFVQVPALGVAAADTAGPGPGAISKYVAPRALLWFRWAALLTWLSGFGSLHVIGFSVVDVFTLQEGKEIFGAGAWIGTIMLANVWFVIWPNQKKVLGIVSATKEEVARARTIALMASRTNVVLSIPVIMFMIGQAHGIPL